MIRSVGIVERAYQLAASGDCPTVTDVRLRLAREGYSDITSHLGGRTIGLALRKLCADAQPIPGPVPATDGP